MFCMCESWLPAHVQRMSWAANRSADSHRDSPRPGRAWAVRSSLGCCRAEEVSTTELHKACPPSRFSKNPLPHVLSFKGVIPKWVMIECPSITFPGVGPQGWRLGEPHAAPSHSPVCHQWHLRPCVYNSCSLKTYILSNLHIKLFGLSPCGEQHAFLYI